MVPVFVDVTGIRRRRIRRAGVLVAAASLSYLPMAASALLPGPSAPAQPGPLSAVGTTGGEAGKQPATTPPSLHAPNPPVEPEPTDPVDAPQRLSVPGPESDDAAPTAGPPIRLPEPAHSQPPDRSPIDPPADPPPAPTTPPAQEPDATTPPPTTVPTAPPTAEPSTDPVVTPFPPIMADPLPGAAG